MNGQQKTHLEHRRFKRAGRLIGYYKDDLARRLQATRDLFSRRAFAVDIHCHTHFSDGLGTVPETYEAAKRVGLDFLFVTDHNSTGQKRHVRKWADASWGQEPGMGGHHIGMLCNRRLFKPKRDGAAKDLARVLKIAPFAWIPHPVGWYPSNWYSDERIAELWTLGESFAMEIINGANKIVNGFDAFDAKAVTVWDRLLCDDRRVTALGGSDAHAPEDLGSCWTGVFAERCNDRTIIKALNEGRCFASEGPLVEFTCDGRPMGSTIRKKRGSRLKCRYRVADSAGVASVRIISDGKVVKSIRAADRTLVEGTWEKKAGAKPTYLRLEVTASDVRRAFSTPVYIQPRV